MSKKNDDDMDFEIKFYEDLLEGNPNFTSVLGELGELYTAKGLYQKGLEIDLRHSLLKSDDAIVLYNLACSYSLVNDMDNSLSSIKKAIKYGYDDIAHLERDNDMENLRKDARFKKYLQELKAQKPTQREGLK